MKFKNIIAIIISLICIKMATAQSDIRSLSLDDVIIIAKERSPDALIAKHRFRSNYWQYRTYKAEYLPQLGLNATLPNFQRSIDAVTQPDGTDIFRERKQARTSADLSLSKNIGLTGGRVFVSSGLQRIDLFADSTISSYLSTPLNIGISQPIFEYNALKWNKKIEPIKYEEAKQSYIENLEDVSIKATNLFFQLLLAQINMKIQETNLANNDTLYKIAKGRYKIGTIAENELLQMELNYLNSQTDIENTRLDLENKIFQLKSFLRIKDDIPLELIPPADMQKLTINFPKALEQARENRSDYLGFDRRMLEAESEVNRAKMQNRFSADLYAVYGLTKSADGLSDVYQSPQDQQQLVLGLEIPILDWGLARGKIKMAESNMELVKTSVEQDMIDFDQEVFIKVMQFNMQHKQLEIAAKSDTVAQKRYDVTKQRYLIGTIDIIELNLAQKDKDNNRRAYISALQTYWQNFYEIRRLTLFDFEKENQIMLDFNTLMQ